MSKATGALLTKLDLPEGTLDNVPCIRIFGRNTAEIENHRGVLEFSGFKGSAAYRTRNTEHCRNRTQNLLRG